MLEIERKSSAMLGKEQITVKNRGVGQVTMLLEVTHGQQWLYRNVHVHDALTGDLASRKKEDIRRELEDQMDIGGEQ